ncbi:hypothetical protein [Nocardia otitidiscaviarum]|uniref:hypothetical protein n=1 Tax=Nocardia otitidiscaviarum TaxID=1823 RepID=UPI001893D8E5|nr:hypothetical protein [Nocardia otitidiscaviarum]MBF6241189.1 hypothetical protein [Nocardia otitidiscaviarum]
MSALKQLEGGLGGYYRDTRTQLDSSAGTLSGTDRTIGQILSEQNTAVATRGSTAAGDRGGVYTPPAGELEMRRRQLRDEDSQDEDLVFTSNTVRILPSDDAGTLNVYKPFTGESFGKRDWITHEQGQLARREVAAYRIDQLFGFGRVPPTALVDGPNGPGSVQQFVELDRGKRWDEYDPIQQQQVAVLHWVIGNSDGHRANYRPDLNGDLVAFDHGYSLPETPDPARGGREFILNSDFVTLHQGSGDPLDESVLRAVDAVRPEHVRAALEDLDLDESAISGALTRLEQIQQLRRIPAAG